jgi:dienelactone hydrolase
VDTELLHKRIVYRVPGMEGIEVRRGLTYRHADETDLLMDVYTPPGLPAGARRPGAVFIHGGPIPADLRPAPTDWGVYRSYGELAAASDFVGATFNHRYHGWPQLDKAAGDIDAAIEYLRARADSFHLDPDRLCLWVFSGGGRFLARALRDRPPFARCLVAYYAPLDLQHQPGEAPVVPPEIVERFSPVAHLRDDESAGIPLFIARAGLDHPRLNESIDRFIARALAANAPLDVANHPRGRHGFDTLDDHPRTHEIIARTVAFINTHLEDDRPAGRDGGPQPDESSSEG